MVDLFRSSTPKRTRAAHRICRASRARQSARWNRKGGRERERERERKQAKETLGGPLARERIISERGIPAGTNR